MTARQIKKMNVALDLEVLPWLEIESGRRGCSMTQLINDALREQRDNAPDYVRAHYESGVRSRELDNQQDG